MSVAADIPAIEAGIDLPAVVRFTTTKQLVEYAGGANDYSGIHYDLDYAIERGFQGVIVHGFLKAAFLAELACQWGGPGSRLIRYAARYRGVDMVGAPITCRGRVSGYSPVDRQVSLDLWTENAEGERTTVATGLLELPQEEVQ